MRRTTTFALLASVLMLVSVAAPAMAIEDGSLSVSVSQDSSGDATVTVTGTLNNSSVAVEGASVSVETVDENASYAGTGEYTTDANGTVSLPAPNETVDVSVTASYDNQTASTTATLEAGSSEEEDDGNVTAFGQRVSSFVHQLQDSNETNDAPFGAQVAAFVVANNPGNAPAHAGPPAWLLDDSANLTTGPPDHAGPPENGSGGPPDDKGNGPPDDRGNGGGPPDDAGQDDDEAEDSDE